MALFLVYHRPNLDDRYPQKTQDRKCYRRNKIIQRQRQRLK